VLIRHLWQLKTVVILHWCLVRAVLLKMLEHISINSNILETSFSIKIRCFFNKIMISRSFYMIIDDEIYEKH
jgi:hypothetical protein